MKPYQWIVGTLITGVLLGWGLYQLLLPNGRQATVSQPPRGGDFSLTSPSGHFHLKDHRGKVVLIYFGYTFCPDICPTNLALLSQALSEMSQAELARVQGVFISVDPERDTLDKLSSYANYFHRAILGMTGTPEAVARVAAQYGAAYHRVEGESRGGYLVDHSSNTYVVAPDGSLSVTLNHASPPQEILAAVRRLLGPGQPTNPN